MKTVDNQPSQFVEISLDTPSSSIGGTPTQNETTNKKISSVCQDWFGRDTPTPNRGSNQTTPRANNIPLQYVLISDPESLDPNTKAAYEHLMAEQSH
ncbi:MAG: hypothetical protein K2X08_08390 [Chlamydiales bacterium]|nr:hypothetical protein [Chlamydiales bacterium]